MSEIATLIVGKKQLQNDTSIDSEESNVFIVTPKEAVYDAQKWYCQYARAGEASKKTAKSTHTGKVYHSENHSTSICAGDFIRHGDHTHRCNSSSDRESNGHPGISTDHGPVPSAASSNYKLNTLGSNYNGIVASAAIPYVTCTVNPPIAVPPIDATQGSDLLTENPTACTNTDVDRAVALATDLDPTTDLKSTGAIDIEPAIIARSCRSACKRPHTNSSSTSDNIDINISASISAAESDSAAPAQKRVCLRQPIARQTGRRTRAFRNQAMPLTLAVQP